MIKLIDILESITKTPKAIILAGPAGSGKTFWSKKLIPTSFKTINSDDTFEELLVKSGIGLNQKDFTPEQLSQSAKFQAQARKISKQDLEDAMSGRKDIVIDGTGASSKTVLKKKTELENLGYEVLMLMVYVSPLVSLERNQKRQRSLMPGIVLRTWNSVNKNIDVYRDEFKDNFILINANPEDANKEFNSELLEPYVSDSKAIGKPKTPEQEAKSKADKEKINKEIEDMVNNIPEFNSIEDTKNKINKFIK